MLNQSAQNQFDNQRSIDFSTTVAGEHERNSPREELLMNKVGSDEVHEGAALSETKLR